MNMHEKGRVTMNANNKLLFFLGAFVSIGVMVTGRLLRNVFNGIYVDSKK